MGVSHQYWIVTVFLRPFPSGGGGVVHFSLAGAGGAVLVGVRPLLWFPPFSAALFLGALFKLS